MLINILDTIKQVPSLDTSYIQSLLNHPRLTQKERHHLLRNQNKMLKNALNQELKSRNVSCETF